MGSLPREKAGVGSAVNDTTRQMGGALGVAIIGSVVSSVYSKNISNVAGQFGVTGDDLTEARSSLGGALKVGGELTSGSAGFIVDVKDSFVDALSNGLRLSCAVILCAAFVAWRFLPARAHDPLADHADHADEAMADAAAVPVPVGGD
jgi:hypothetical protein